MKTKTQRICRDHAKNLEILIRAAKNGDLALVECQLKATGEVVAALCAIEAGEFTINPFAVMLNGNPYEMLNPPVPGGKFAE